jgi:hypothetical protein
MESFVGEGEFISPAADTDHTLKNHAILRGPREISDFVGAPFLGRVRIVQRTL